MPTHDKMLVSLVAILAVALTAVVLTIVNSESSSAALADAGPSRRMEALSDEVASIAARLSAIEARLELPNRQPVAQAHQRDPEPSRTELADGGAPADLIDHLATRMSALEQRMMEAGIPEPWVPPGAGASLEALRNAFNALTASRSRVTGEDAHHLIERRRLDLCRRLLTEFPAERSTRHWLRDVIGSSPAAEARDALRDLGGRAGFKDWEVKQFEANTYGLEQGELRRASLRAVAGAQNAPEYERARALEGIAYSLRFEKRFADALTVLRDLVARFESSAECNGEVEIARKAIQEMESGKQ